jgi:aspartate racemase
MARKVIGIMGGMGPDATVDLYVKIIEETRRRGAKRDQDHLEVVISSVPQTPDRTEAIFGTALSPVPELIRSARRLEAAGAGLIAIPCNSAHFFYDELASAVSIPILHMVRLAADFAACSYPDIKRAGILATDGTLRTRLYHDALEAMGIKPVSPDPETQKMVMEAVFGPAGIKSVYPSQVATAGLVSAAKKLISDGVGVIIAGCTEIPLGLKGAKLAVPLIDSTAVLAAAAVSAAMEC